MKIPIEHTNCCGQPVTRHSLFIDSTWFCDRECFMRFHASRWDRAFQQKLEGGRPIQFQKKETK